MADGGSYHVQRLGGGTVRDAFCLRQNATGGRYVWRGGLLCGGGVADGGRCHVQCLGGEPSATHFACGKMLRVAVMFGVAGCFAG